MSRFDIAFAEGFAFYVERLQWIDIKELDSNRFGLRSIRTGIERLKTAITDNEK